MAAAMERPSLSLLLDITYSLPCQGDSIAMLGSSTDSVCLGDSLTLTAMGQLNDATTWVLYADSCGGSYIDSNNTGVFNLAPDTTTRYYVRGEGGCTVDDSCAMTSVHVTTIDTNVVVTITGDTLSTTETGATYQWIDCDRGNQPVPGATMQNFTPSTNSMYAVVITKNGCTDTSSCVFGGSVSQEEFLTENQLEMYPNPTAGSLQISVKGEKIDGLRLRDLSGKTLLSIDDLSSQEYRLNLENLPRGTYLLTITVADQRYARKLIKK
ncbi:MAG: T9SS type A sorting domain-containing protein [Owenweeksia sp.]|nr:T9SS type A sorting domain-containing protein [Owenweeksia sp.]